MMTKEQLGILIRKYLSGTATADETEKVEQWYQDYGHNLEVYVGNEEEASEQELHDKILNRLRTTLHGAPKAIVTPMWKKLAAAASIAMVLAAGGWYFIQNRSTDKTQVARQTEVSPGFEQAILTTSDGRKIELGSNSQQPINEKNGVVISNDGHQLTYASSSTGNTVFFNTLEVPRKGVYSLELADGTKVWLNSLSSLTYPTSFPGRERRVSIKGEAYFEIAKNPRQPFIVDVEGGQAIEVLGTRFNVNAYTNEQQISTTLLEGAVRVKAGDQLQKLSPGQEAQFSLSNKTLHVRSNADANDVISWKNGFFVCNGKDLQAILRQVMRWYDIDVAYQGEIRPESFVGTISRNMNLSELLEVLEITGVHFSLQGKTLTVLP